MDKNYVDEIIELARKINQINDKIDLLKERKRGKAPSQAFSDFLTNKEQGDWAEDVMLRILNRDLNKFKTVSYGRKDDLIAGDEGFKQFYENYQDELDSIGKCPDLLIFDNSDLSIQYESEIASRRDRKKIISIAQKAVAALEVRSSAFIVRDYCEYIRTVENKNKRTFLSFTPKVEDLSVIIKWITIHGVQHYYVQVFLDSIYVISFKKILNILSNPKNDGIKYYIEKNPKNQFKSTIHINLDEGICICSSLCLPAHNSQIKKLKRGRLLFYVQFKQKEIPILINKTNLKEIFGLG